MELLSRMKNLYSASRVRAFVDRLLANEQQSISSEAIPLESDTDFLLLVFTLIRAGERGMGYKVRFHDGSVMRGGYRIPKMTITMTTANATSAL
jgi:hypothetical protein